MSPHFFVPSVDIGELRLSETDSRHALRSLRLRDGDQVTLADGRGALGRGRLSRAEDGLASITVEEVSRVARRSPLVSVAFPPPKGQRLAWAVQKLAELGVDEVVLIETERSVRGWTGDRAGRALDRVRAVAREAGMQSRQPFLMDVRTQPSIARAMEEGSGQTVVLWEKAAERLSAVLPPGSEELRVVVGPEGGISEAEAEGAARAGGLLASLGDSVLRTETAAVVGAALVLARYGRLG